MKDHRKLLMYRTTRKPSSWDDTALIRDLNDAQVAALRDLPQIEIDIDTNPLEDFIDDNIDLEAGDEVLLEAVVFFQRGPTEIRSFYVNTEGSAYARYAFEFNPEILED
jgi:hypothetical protein